ncbi:MAG: phosphatidylserine decarboxylase, partial [Chlamydiota bacterium]
HFPCSCTPSKSFLINGPLYSVNPLALRKRIEILAQNKREITILGTECFGKVLFIEVGATCVGAIHQTYTPEKLHEKGAEKGYFSFGGSSLVLLFEPGAIVFDQDLVEASKEGIEVLGLMGQTLGHLKF